MGVWGGRRRRGGGGGRFGKSSLFRGCVLEGEDGRGEEVGCIWCGDLLHISVVLLFVSLLPVCLRSFFFPSYLLHEHGAGRSIRLLNMACMI